MKQEDREFLGEMIINNRRKKQEETLKAFGARTEVSAPKDETYEAIDFYGDEALAKWVMVMSDGRYGRGMASAAQLQEYVECLPLSEVEIVDFLVKVTKGRLHVAVQGSGSLLWLVWNGRIYDERNEAFTDTITNRLRRVLEVISVDVEKNAVMIAQQEQDSGVAKMVKAMSDEVAKFVKSLKTAAGLRNVKNVMTGNEYLRFEEDDHENDARGYVVEANGNLRHMDNLDVIVDPDPSLLIRKTIGVNATDDWEDKGMWSEFLRETFGDWDEEKGVFVRNEGKELLLSECAGVALLGTGQSKHMINIVGSSNSGKSLYIDGLKQVFGDYQSKMSNAGIVKMMGTNFYQDEARGQRLLWISEPDRKNVDEAFLKALTGGQYETLTTSRKGKSSVSWSPQCFFHVASNDPIQFDASDDALNKRILTISADNSVTEDDERFDPDRMKKIVDADVESIYRWVLAGAASFLANGGKLHIPDEIKEIQTERGKNSNPAVQWLHYMIEEGKMALDPTVKSMSKMHPWRLKEYQMYQYWEAQQGIRTGLSNDQVKAAIEKFTGRPVNKNTDRKQSNYLRLWGVVEGPNAGDFLDL